MHDFNPGVADFDPAVKDTGLFWTVPVAKSAVKAEAGRTRGSFVARDLEIDDYHDVANAVVEGHRDGPTATRPPATPAAFRKWRRESSPDSWRAWRRAMASRTAAASRYPTPMSPPLLAGSRPAHPTHGRAW